MLQNGSGRPRRRSSAGREAVSPCLPTASSAESLLAASPRASCIAKEESEALRAALHRLPEDYRTVLRLRNWECLPLAEVGRRMNRSEEAARKLWSRAIVRLQQELDGHSD